MLYNRKGFGNQLMMILVIGMVLAFIMLAIWVGGLFLPLLTGTGTLLVNTISTSINTQSPNSELANATNIALPIASRSLGVVEGIVYVFMVFIFLGFIALCFYVRTYPFLAFFWVFIIIALVFLSMFISNSYISASLVPATNSYYTTWGQNDFILSNLPFIIAVVGVVGGIILFVLASREPEAEVQQL